MIIAQKTGMYFIRYMFVLDVDGMGFGWWRERTLFNSLQIYLFSKTFISSFSHAPVEISIFKKRISLELDCY